MKGKPCASDRGMQKFFVMSPTIKRCSLTNMQVLHGFGYSGGNESPQLHWSGAPVDTRSFAVTAYDPDAPTGRGWWHWVAYNIPVNITSLSGGRGGADGGKSLPEGAAMGRNDFGSGAYGGAPPPSGRRHRYIIMAHALKTKNIEVSEDASPAMIGFNQAGNCIGTAVLIAAFGSQAKEGV